MALVTELELPVFDYTDESLRGEAYHELLEGLAEQSWIVTSPLAYIVLDHEAGEFFLRSKHTTFPGQKIAELFGIEDGMLREEIDRNILHLNGGDHRRLRSLVNPSFTPRAANRWRPAMRGFLEQLWDGVAQAGECEFVGAFAKPYPSLTIATVMGAPLADADRLHHWSNWIQRQFDPPSLMRDRPLIEEAVAEFYEYCHALLDRRRAEPGDDLVSQLLAAEAEGDRLSDVECVNLVLNVLIGGVDTTQSQLAQGMRLFAEHPDQWALLPERPELVPQAVEEILRYEPITPFTSRICLEELEFRDVTFPKDTIVMVCAATGNRDVPGGDSFDITAQRGERLLTFGAGIHYCLGANLARAELEEALTFLAPRMPNLQLAGTAELEAVHGIYGVARLPLRWG